MSVFIGCSGEDNNHTRSMELNKTEGFITTADGIRLFYQKTGASQSTVIIPNGLYLYEDFKYLAEDHTLIFYDMRNRGRSDHIDDSTKLSRGIRHDVEDLETVRKHFGKVKVHLIGHSYLGLMVFLYASAYPDHVESMVQIGPMQLKSGTTYPEHLTAREEKPVPAPETMEELQRLEQSGYAANNPKEYCKKWWSAIMPVYVSNPADTTKMFSGMCEFPNEWPVNLLKHLSDNIMPSIEKLDIGKELLKRCDLPVLTIHGTRDRAVPYGAGREWAFNLPDARLLTIDEGGHMPWIELPGSVFPAIRTFLKGKWPDKAEEINAADFKE